MIQTITVDFNKIACVEKRVVNKAVYNKLQKLTMQKIIPDGTTLIHINQYNINKQSLEKKDGGLESKIPDVGGLVTTSVIDTKLGKLRIRFQQLQVWSKNEL